MNDALDTIRYGARMLRKAPGPTLTVLVALALGIGLPTLMFSLIRGALLPTLPFENGERIVRLSRAGDSPVTAADVELWSARQRSFDGMAPVATGSVALGIEGRGTEPLSGASIDPAVLPLLSVEPLLGRAFTAADAEPGAPAVVLVGYQVWRDRFDSDPSTVGRAVRVNGRVAEVVGVMPERFGFPFDEQIWSPMRVDPLREVLGRSSEQAGTLAFLVGRLREGVSAREAADELTRLSTESAAEAGIPPEEVERVLVVAYTNIFSSEGQRAGIGALMLGAALMVLLVACANVTNVLLARTAVRAREVAIRGAMGASRGRIAGQFLSEVALLTTFGAAGGVAIALIGTRAIQNLMEASAGAPFWIEFRVDVPVLAFVLVIAGMAALAAGLGPALQASRSNPHDVLKDGARGASGFHLGKVMRRLVGVEMALSFVLLVAAGLFIRSAVNYDRMEFAFEPEEVYQARIRMPESYGTADARALYITELEEALAALPEAEAAALGSDLPGIGSAVAGVLEIDGRPVADAERPRARSIVVTPGYFDLFRAPVLSGRSFDESDRAGELPVAIVNTAFERRHFPAGALDQRIRLDVRAEEPTEWLTIVGVAPDLMAGGVGRETEEAVYLPVAQSVPQSIVLLVRPSADFATLPSAVRDAVTGLDQDVPLFDVRRLREAIDAANSQYRWLSALFLLAGGIALFLAAIGLYGVMAFWVAQRTREIGVRMALGGQRARIVGLVLRQGMVQTGLGLVAGVALAIPVARVLGAALFEVSPYDPVVFGSILVVLVAAAALGCWLPARRATAIDPLEALAED
jgi:putative ABC transport system permease protein